LGAFIVLGCGTEKGIAMKLSDFVFEFIKGLGLKDVFVLPGGGAMHLVDSLGKSGMNYVCMLHEQGASIASEAYSQYTQNFGVALVTTGPGGTNAITGCASAWLDSVPCVFISGQVKRPDLAIERGVRQFGFQEINIVDIVRPITKYAEVVLNPLEIKLHLEKAIYLAKSGRPGPVWIDIPLDVQAEDIDVSMLKGFEYRDKKDFVDLGEQVGELIEMINRSKCPVALIGNGARISGVLNELVEFLASHNIPIQTTWKTIDAIEDDNPLYAGRPGLVANRYANLTLQNADLVISFGSRLDLGITAYNHRYFGRAAKKAVIDIDEKEINKLNMDIDLAICADLRDVFNSLKRLSDRINVDKRDDWLEAIAKWKQKYSIKAEFGDRLYSKLTDYLLIDLLSDLLGEGDLLVPGSSGACSERTMQAFRVKKGIRIINSPSLGSMGFGLPASIGACIASGRRRTICINGDGGFVMNIQELEVVRRLNLPIKFFVLNNDGYGSIRGTQERHFGRYTASTPDSGMTLPNISAVARAFGIRTIKADDYKTLRERVEEVLNTDGPVLCEVFVDKDTETIPRVSSKMLKNGKMVSLPMEDMYPFLDRDELKREMFVDLLEESLRE